MSASFGRILSIDDEPVLRESIVAYLEDSGFEVLEAEDGEKGLEIFRNEKPDLVLSDIQMPGLNGLQVLDTITKESPDTPVIMVSGAGGMDDAIEALRLGAWDYIVKPITDMKVLEHAVCKALERARLVVENKAYRKELEDTNNQLRLSLAELEEDQKAGRYVQKKILPCEIHEFGDYRFAHKVLPSLYLSGDFVDYFQITPNLIGFYVADVSGHGASSAFVTVFLKSLVSQCLADYKSSQQATILHPDQLLKKVSDEVFRMKLGKYLTMIYGIIDIDTNEFSYSIGGHYPSPIISDGDNSYFLEGGGFAVGIYDKATYECQKMKLPEKFSLMMFSDGIMELLKGDDLDSQESRLLAQTKDLNMQVEEILANCDVKLGNTLPDDITLFTIQKGL